MIWVWLGIGIVVGWFIAFIVYGVRLAMSINYMTRPVTPEEQRIIKEAMDEGI